MKLTWIAALFSVLLACSDGSREESASVGVTGSASAPAANAPPMMSRQVAGIGAEKMQDQAAADATVPGKTAITAGTATEVAPSMLIRTGSASVEVPRLDPAIIKVRQLAAQLGGYVANSSISGGQDQIRSATLELKIPAAKYDQAIGGLGGIGKVESVNTSVEDVGEEYVDITARVTNAKRLEERLTQLLATRTGKLEDVLAVERELARVREEIERYEGRLRFLRTRAAVSTLSVTVHEPAPLLGQNPGENPITSAFRQAWRNFVGFVAWFIAYMGILIPLGVVLVGLWQLVKWLRRRFSGRM
jgi:hypothetical protein